MFIRDLFTNVSLGRNHFIQNTFNKAVTTVGMYIQNSQTIITKWEITIALHVDFSLLHPSATVLKNHYMSTPPHTHPHYYLMLVLAQ